MTQTLSPDTLRYIDSLAREEWQLPVLTTTAGETDENLEAIDLSGILQSANDLYYSTAAFHLGQLRYRIRGYQSDFTAASINGVRFNDEERGWVSFSSWGGLNDITRYRETQVGIVPSLYYFSPAGGYIDINARASAFSGTRLSYALSNRTYRHRIMATHATGWSDNHWAITVSLSGRYAREGYVEGTFYESASYFLAAEKKLTPDKSINFACLGAYTYQGKQSINVEETYLLTGTHYYNSYWGYQNGKKRNSRVSYYHKPILLLTYDWKINEKTFLSSTTYTQFGYSYLTGLNWYDAKDPRPDYYRYLPTYYTDNDSLRAAQLTLLWQQDINTSHIDWHALYQANYNNLYLVENADGITGNNINGLRSKYILERYYTDPFLLGLNTYYRKWLKDNLSFNAGGQIETYTSHNYKKIDDLLGGDFWLDVNQFAEQDFSDPRAAQNDLNKPNHIVRKDEIYGYHYKLHKQSAELFAQVDYTYKKMEMFSAFYVSYTSYYREGLMQNGLFPEHSFGKSSPNRFFNSGMKAGAGYLLNRHFSFFLNGTWYNQPPSLQNAYISPRIRNHIVPGLRSAEIISADFTLRINYPKLKVRITSFYTEHNNNTWQRTFYHEIYRTVVNYAMQNVDYLYQGIEGFAEYAIKSWLSAYIVAGKGQYLYNSRPIATITRDNSSETMAENRVLYIKNYRIGGIPQTATSLGLRYNRNFWYAGINVNYLNDIFVDINPDRRSVEALEGLIPSDPQYNQLIQQTKLPDAYTLDAYLGKSWKVKKYLIGFNLNVNNLLNNQNIVMFAFEQMRYDPRNIEKFPHKFVYQTGLTYFGMLTLRF